MKKVRASQQKRNQIEAVIKGGSQEAIEGLHLPGQEKFWQELLEAEVDEHLGRDWYQRSENSRQGYRIGTHSAGSGGKRRGLGVFLRRSHATRPSSATFGHQRWGTRTDQSDHAIISQSGPATVHRP